MFEDDQFVIHGPPPFEPLPTKSIGQLMYDELITNPDETEALVDIVTGKSITYKEIFGKSCSLAESLLKSGYGKDTMLAICSENNIEYYIPVLSGLYLGAPTAHINYSYTASELTHALTVSKPQVVFCSNQVRKQFILLKLKLPFIEKIIIIDNEDKQMHTESMKEFIDKALRGAPTLYRFNFPKLNLEEDLAFILYSSGTTGLSKGVMLTQKNLLIRYMQAFDPRYSSLEGGGTVLGILPFFHAYGLVATLMCLHKKTKILVMRRFEENLFLDTIQRYKVSDLYLVPPLVVFLEKSPLIEKYDLSSVTGIVCGAASLSKDTEAAVTKRLNIESFRQGYGLTETTLAFIYVPLGCRRAGSSGTVVPYMSAKVRDPKTRKSLGPNQVGEICAKGGQMMKGYYGNKSATEECYTSDGWFLTGDLGYYDEEGYFYIVDRMKELIKYKGFQVAPAELEALLLLHPKIKDAGVVGLPNEEVGELPLAFVVKESESNLTEREVEHFVEERISPQKKLRGGVIFVPEIPRISTGKIMRRKLRDMLKKHNSKL